MKPNHSTIEPPVPMQITSSQSTLPIVSITALPSESNTCTYCNSDNNVEFVYYDEYAQQDDNCNTKFWRRNHRNGYKHLTEGSDFEFELITESEANLPARGFTIFR